MGAGELEEENVKQLVKVQQRFEKAEGALLAAQNENQELRARIAELEGGGAAA